MYCVQLLLFLFLVQFPDVTGSHVENNHSGKILTRQDLFIPSPRYPCFRQPVILATSQNILAFAENRNVSSCAPASGRYNQQTNLTATKIHIPAEIGSLHLRRSNDGGDSWSPIQSIFVGNIDFYTAVYDAEIHKIWLMVQHKIPKNVEDNGTDLEDDADVVEILVSSDFGETWLSKLPLNVDLPSPFKGGSLKPSVGHGIQIQNSEDDLGNEPSVNGRLIVPFVCTNSSAPKPSGDSGLCPGCVFHKVHLLFVCKY